MKISNSDLSLLLNQQKELSNLRDRNPLDTLQV